VLIEVNSTKTYVLSSSLKVVDKLKVSSASYSYVPARVFPSDELPKSISYPDKLSGIKDIQEGQYLHLAVKAGFEKSSETPQ